MSEWIAQRGPARFIALANAHMVTEARCNPEFRHMLNQSGLTVPDGTPLVWCGRARGHQLRRRVYGPELLEEFCRTTEGNDYRHFFYGGAPGVATLLASQLQCRFPGMQIAGTCSPPFRPLTWQEQQSVIRSINEARPDVVWVGLGCPKQERWMYDHLGLLDVPVMVGVGQAFNIHAGLLRQAPRFMREHGLEWLFRLCLEPRRLWRRYLLGNTKFLLLLLLDSIGVGSR